MNCLVETYTGIVEMVLPLVFLVIYAFVNYTGPEDKPYRWNFYVTQLILHGSSELFADACVVQLGPPKPQRTTDELFWSLKGWLEGGSMPSC